MQHPLAVGLSSGARNPGSEHDSWFSGVRAATAAPGMAWQLAVESSSQNHAARVSYTKASILVPT